MTDQLQHLGETVDQLCDTTTSHIPLYGWTASRHRRMVATRTIRHQPLLDALQTAVYGRGRSDHDGGRSVPGSRPPLDMGALDRRLAIEAGVDHWRTWFQVAPRGDLKRDLRGLVGGASRAPSDQLAQLARETDRWLTWCRVIAGWDTPAWRPNVPCLVEGCGVRGLRVRLDRSTACCVACGSTWDASNIGILARHIREAKGEDAA